MITPNTSLQLDIDKIREDFPILHQSIHGKPLVYLDTSVTSQKPNSVINAISHYYQHNNANVHRGVYTLSERATFAFEKTREQIKSFINASATEEIIFTKGATEGINLVAQSYGRSQFKPGDEVIISILEHHSNIVPWQILSKELGIVLRVIPISDTGELDLTAYQQLLNPRTKMVAITHASNALGTINPIKKIIALAHEQNIPVLIDGAQAFPHLSVNVQDLDCDFYVFSAHKAYGPTGVGVLYGKKPLLEAMPPYQGGGDMIEQVTLEGFTTNKLPYKFEAGTPNIANVIGFAAALDYLEKIGMQQITKHEQTLLHYAHNQLSQIPGLRIIGTASQKVGVVSFVLDDIHPHDIGTILDHEGIAVRAGHHCAMPLMNRLNVPATVRASFGIYNKTEEIDILVDGLHQVKRLFA
jgi:cysteine desulfurase/selenocysteine lyase